MGGAPSRCATYVDRDGKTMCLHSRPKYDRWIKESGNEFRVTNINGSYTTSAAASANTHAGGGAADIEGDGYSADRVRHEANRARGYVLVAYPRLWKGNWHIHVLDPACPSLSPEAAAQIVLFGKGFDALVGNNPDTSERSNVEAIMATFAHRLDPPKSSTSTSVSKPKPVNYGYPYTYKAGWYPYPGRQGGSYYGPSKAGVAWYSGKVAGGTKTGVGASGGLTLAWVRGHIARIQRCVGVVADGRYGPVTVAAVKKWQKRNRLSADGIVGPRTWAAMARSRGQ